MATASLSLFHAICRITIGWLGGGRFLRAPVASQLIRVLDMNRAGEVFAHSITVVVVTG